jgi:hypothetical protein
MVDQDGVLLRDIEVLVALAARLRQLGRVRGGSLDARGENVVIAVAVAAGG